MDLSTPTRAVVMFAVTNIDDLLLLALFFGQARRRGAAAGIVVGQYLGFLGAGPRALRGRVVLGPRSSPSPGHPPTWGWCRSPWACASRGQAWRGRDVDHDEPRTAPGPLVVAGVALRERGRQTLASTSRSSRRRVAPTWSSTSRCSSCSSASRACLGRFLATRAPIARALARYGNVALSAVLVGIGLLESLFNA